MEPTNGARARTGSTHARALEQVRDTAGDVGEWLYGHRSTIGATVGTASLLSMAPILRPATGAAARSGLISRLAHAVVPQRLASSSVGAQAAAGWRTLHNARIGLGETTAGKALLAAQGPLAVAGVGVGVLNLRADVRDFQAGKRPYLRTAVDAISVVPALSAGVKQVARATAAHREARAAAQAATTLGKAAETTRSVAGTVRETKAAQLVTDATATTQNVSSAARKGAQVARQQTAVTGIAPKPLPASSTFVVDDLSNQVSEVERKTAQALQVTAAEVGHVAPREQLVRALELTRTARSQLQQARQVSAPLTTAARKASSVQSASATTSQNAVVLNSSIQVQSNAHGGSRHRTRRAGYDLFRGVVGGVLRRNAAAPAS